MTELANEEADRVEAEAPDDNEPDDSTAEPESEHEPEQEAFDMEKGVKQLEAENTRHAKRVAEIMGTDAADLIPCPTCVVGPTGFVFQLPPAEPEYKDAADTQTCEACGGMGDVLSGSHNDRSKLKQCASCSGQGYVFKTNTPTAPAGQPPAVPIDPEAVAALRAAGYTVVEPYVAPPVMPA